MALFPPIVAASMPAFDVNSGRVRIYFTLSEYTSANKDNINSVHVTVRRQNSNVNVLNSQTQIIQKVFFQQQTDKAFHRYYVDILDTDIKPDNNSSQEQTTNFKINALYKVQLRLSTQLPSKHDYSYYTSNPTKFSEWSTVCIIKPIVIPDYYIQELVPSNRRPNTKPGDDEENRFTYNFAEFTGIYQQNDSTQQLKSWRLRLLKNDIPLDEEGNIVSIEDQYILADSNWMSISANNFISNTDALSFDCNLSYQLSDGQDYKLYFQIETKNGYTDATLYSFTQALTAIDKINGELNTFINEEEGYIKLNFTSSQNYGGNLVIRRSDSKHNFMNWMDLKNFTPEDGQNPSFVYYDFTAQSGIFYKYLVQKRDARGRRGTPCYDQTQGREVGTMGQWEHAFLLETTGNGNAAKAKQLKLKYDFQISSYKTNISETKTDTIGSKYPFIRRNGNMYYRSFPCTGTITQFMDQSDLFTSKTKTLNGYQNAYDEFRGQIGNYVTMYDYTYERKFREQVEEFLYNNKPKLYKSMQQGNIFIKLMDVSLTPKNELGRLVYTFSATAYEIDQPTLDTFNNYGLIDVGTFNPNIFTIRQVLSQLNTFDASDQYGAKIFRAGQDIIGADSKGAAANSIASHIKYMQSFNNKIVTDFNINWLRITVESDPYLIVRDSNGMYYPYDDIDTPISNGSDDPIGEIQKPIEYKLYQLESSYNTDVYLGTLFNFYINSNEAPHQIIISPPNNIYEIKETDFSFSKYVKIVPAKDTLMSVDYRLIDVIQEDLSNVPKNIQINKVNGQLIGTYTEKDNIVSQINVKYKYTYDQTETKRIKRYVNGVNTISIDTQPGTIIKAKTTADTDEPSRFIVNETGQLNFDPGLSTVYISHFKICGINVQKSKTNNRGVVSSSALKDKYTSLSYDNQQKNLIFSYILEDKNASEDKYITYSYSGDEEDEKNLIFSNYIEQELNTSILNSDDKYLDFSFSKKRKNNLIFTYLFDHVKSQLWHVGSSSLTRD